MAKKSVASKAKAARRANEPVASKRKLILLPVAALAIAGAAFGINALESGKRELHDLSVIGQGQPVIVQVFDPQCQVCKRMKNIGTSTFDQDTAVQYRVADITESEGRAFQNKHAVPHQTMLYFDKRGKRVHSTYGLQTKEQINSAVKTHLVPG